MKIKVLEHLFQLLNILLEEGKPMSVAELSRRSGIEKNAAWRIVSDLCEQGYLRRISYRTVEPGPGLLFLGQGAYSEAFFPRLVYRELRKAEKEIGVSCTLAGLFHRHVIYFYRSDQLFESWRWPLYGSNIALCILTRRDGPEQAHDFLAAELRAAGLPGDEEKALLTEIEKNIDHVVKRGYCVQHSTLGNNIAFPLVHGREVYGLAFYLIPNDERKLSQLIASCSRLRARLTAEE